MFYRVPMNIIAMCGVILFIADRMFPKPPLPDRPFTMFLTRSAYFLHGNPRFCARCESPLYQSPASRIIRVVWGQSPQTVQMVGQQYQRIYLKRMRSPHHFQHLSQSFACLIGAQQGSASIRDHREKICAAGPRTYVIRHRSSFWWAEPIVLCPAILQTGGRSPPYSKLVGGARPTHLVGGAHPTPNWWAEPTLLQTGGRSPPYSKLVGGARPKNNNASRPSLHRSRIFPFGKETRSERAQTV